MLIVPDADALSVEARVAPSEIDRIYPGQPAFVRFRTFNQRTTPELNGEVTRISADVSQDQKTGVNYYTIRVALPVSEIARLGSPKLIPGMPVDTFVQTGLRTAFSYLVRPLSDQIARAFRER
jgi:HlyD family secretion protein